MATKVSNIGPRKSRKQKTANIQPVKKKDSLAAPSETKPSVAVSKARNQIVTKLWTHKQDPRRGAKADSKLKDMRPLGGLQVYQPVDPYRQGQRNLFRLIMKMVPQINRANKLIQKLVATEYTTTISPRLDQEIVEEKLDKWRHTKISIPYVISRKGAEIPPGLKPKMSPSEIKEWMDRLFIKLDLQQLTYNSYLFRREQGRCVVGMFPEVRDELGEYQIPQAMRLIRPDYTLRPLINKDTGGLEAVEIIGLTTNGGRLDARRAIYFVNQDNLDIFADFYGVSEIEPLIDVGETLLTIYAQDFKQIALHTWWQPKIFKMTIPARDADKPNTIMDEFLVNMRDAGGKDIVLTQTVELVSGTGTTNSGDISGVVEIVNESVDAVLGFYNIPPFLLAKGKVGNLGGNANREEMDAFLNIEIRPEQMDLENTIEKQGYDRVLAILFQVEPNEVNDESVPVKLEHHFKKPDISAAVNLEQYEIIKDMAANGWIDVEKAMEKLGLTDILKINVTRGGDTTPTIKTWVKTNDHWQPRHKESTKFKPSKHKMQIPSKETIVVDSTPKES